MENIKEVLSIAVGSHQEGFTIVADVPGRPIIYSNQGFERLTGYAAAEIIGRHCLIVEDNLINQIILQKTLETKGCKVTVANHGQEALEQLEKHEDFSMIFMDIQMPVMDGIECTKKIRENISTSVPIIAVTANFMPEDQALAREAGMNEFIAKPFEASQIERMLERFKNH